MYQILFWEVLEHNMQFIQGGKPLGFGVGVLVDIGLFYEKRKSCASETSEATVVGDIFIRHRASVENLVKKYLFKLCIVETRFSKQFPQNNFQSKTCTLPLNFSKAEFKNYSILYVQCDTANFGEFIKPYLNFPP